MNSIIKHSLIALAGITCVSFMSSCNDSFMERFPETDISENMFFHNPEDLEIYCNSFYSYYGLGWGEQLSDAPSDNTLYIEDDYWFQLMRGEMTPDKMWMWSWGSVRNINYMLARMNQVGGAAEDIAHWEGFARLMRAKVYYDMVYNYSDVPWYNRDLQTTDTELLYKTQDSRQLVVDSIMADLDFAVNNMKWGSSRTRIFREAALAWQARIALYEGTTRKYHPELGLNDGDRFLKVAAEAAKKLMDTGEFSISTQDPDGVGAYRAMFCQQDLTGNPEMILFQHFDSKLDWTHNQQYTFDNNFSLSRSLMEDYLYIMDGKAVPFQTVENYDKKTFAEIFENRDPRMAQTFMTPGVVKTGYSGPYRPNQLLGGYPQVKFLPLLNQDMSWTQTATDVPYFRYAEILLIYAEAKAELGTLTQDDVDQTINAIRDRVGLPHANLSEWLSNIDPVQNARYSNVQSTQKGAVLEVRRERRIELEGEGFRLTDLRRWCLGKLMEYTEGAYIPGQGYYDVTGDGEPDIAFMMTQADTDNIPQEDRDKYSLTVYTLESSTIGLSQGDHGYIYIKSQKGKYNFVEPKYYYYPMATQDLVINENLKQNKYWN